MRRSLQIKSRLRFAIAVRPDAAVIRRDVERFHKAVVERVMAEIARTVAQEILARIPRGHGSKMGASYTGLKTLWAHWASQPAASPDGAWIGNVEQMDAATRGQNNMTSKHGTWRYGSWFNLEWGREWPAEGDSWIYQENPGPAGSPKQSRPPGAGPADIDMRKWMTRAPKSGGGYSYSSPRLYSRSSKHAEAHLKLVVEWERRSNARSKSFMGQKKGRSSGAPRLTGQFGQAPIRLGYAHGMQIAEEKLPALMREALVAAGKAHRA